MSARETLHAAVMEVTPFDVDEEADAPESGFVTGWVMVAEWQGDDGNRWLSKLSSNALGDGSLPSWTERGMIGEVADHWDTD